MNLRNASTFLFIAAIIVLFSELLRNLILYAEIGSEAFSIPMGLYAMARILNGVLFLLIAISYMGKQYNPESRKLLGLFLAIFAGTRLLLDGYSVYKTIGLDYDMVFHVFNVIYLLSGIPLMLIGIAFYGTDKQFIRATMIAGMVTFVLFAIMPLYEITRQLMNDNFFSGGRWMWFNLVNMLGIVFPVAQFFWALAVYKQAGKPDKVNDSTSVIDQL